MEFAGRGPSVRAFFWPGGRGVSLGIIDHRFWLGGCDSLKLLASGDS